MKNEDEIKFNCRGLVHTWMDVHKDIINGDSKFSLVYNEEVVNYNDIEELAKGLMSHIALEHKGTVYFLIDNVQKESFDII